MPPIRRAATRLAAGLTLLAAYAAGVVWLTWPLGAKLATHLPNTAFACSFDTLYAGWTLAHEARALVSAPLGLADANIYHPTPGSLFYGPLGLGALPYFAPVFWLTGNPTLALNGTLLACVVLTALALHAVVVAWTGSHAGGFLAAGVFLTTRFTLWTWLPTAPQYAVLHYLPPIVWLAASSVEHPGRRWPLLALVVLQVLTDAVYVAPAVLAPLVLLALLRLLRPESRRDGLALLGIAAAAGLVLAPVLAGYAEVRAANPELASQSYWRSAGAPAAGLSLLGPRHPTAVPPLALLVIAAGVASLVWERGRGVAGGRRAWLHAALWTGVGIALALEPQLRPFPALQSGGAPLLGVLRAPERLGVAALIGLSLLVGLAAAECARRLPSRGGAGSGGRAVLVRGALTLALAFGLYRAYAGAPWPAAASGGREALPERYPLARAIGGDSPLTRILQRPGGPLLELPLSPPKGGFLEPVRHARAMYRSIFHGRPLLNGYASYWPAGFRERMALAARLPEPYAIGGLRRETGLDVIWVHTDKLRARARRTWRALAERGGDRTLRLVARDGDDLLFQVRAPSAPAVD